MYWHATILVFPICCIVQIHNCNIGFSFLFYLHIICCTLHIYINVFEVNLREMKRQIHKILKITLFQWLVVNIFIFTPKTDIHVFHTSLIFFLSVIYNCQILFILICLLKSNFKASNI